MCTALLTILSVTAVPAAQSHSETGLRVSAVVTSTESNNALITITFLNESKHSLRLPLRGFMCGDLRGWISARFTFKAHSYDKTPQTDNGPKGCGIAVGEPVEHDIVKAAALWNLLPPGKSFEVRDDLSKLIPGALHPGIYSVQAIYNGYDLSTEDLQKLTAVGIEIPTGKFESNKITVDLK